MAYNEDEERDENGRWSGGGGGDVPGQMTEELKGIQKEANIKNGLDNKIAEIQAKMDKIDPETHGSSGKYNDQKVSNHVEKAKEWVALNEQKQTFERSKEIYSKASKSVATMGAMLSRGTKPDGSKFSKDEKEWLSQQISINQKHMDRIGGQVDLR
jgi:hypothetical protein